MMRHDLDIIYEQLIDKYDLLLTNTFALDAGYTIDVKVLCGESVIGKFNLYREYDDCGEFVFSVEYAPDLYTHWHPYSREQALEDVVNFMEGKCKWCP